MWTNSKQLVLALSFTAFFFMISINTINIVDARELVTIGAYVGPRGGELASVDVNVGSGVLFNVTPGEFDGVNILFNVTPGLVPLITANITITNPKFDALSGLANP